MIDIFVSYPPDRAGRVAELHVLEGEGVDVPAEVFRNSDGEVRIRLFSKGDGVAWEYLAPEFVAAVSNAIRIVDG